MIISHNEWSFSLTRPARSTIQWFSNQQVGTVGWHAVKAIMEVFHWFRRFFSQLYMQILLEIHGFCVNMHVTATFSVNQCLKTCFKMKVRPSYRSQSNHLAKQKLKSNELSRIPKRKHHMVHKLCSITKQISF